MKHDLLPMQSSLDETGLNEWLTRLAEESLADPMPSIPAAAAFRELRAIHWEAIDRTTAFTEPKNECASS